MISIRPDWVMTGFAAHPALVPCTPGQVVILASTRLTQAQLEYTARSYQFTDWADFRRNFRPHHTLAVELDDFVVVIADTYAEALAKLFAHWLPPERAALEAKTPQEEAMTYPSTGGHDPSVPAGAADTIHGVALSTRNHPADGPGVNYSTPDQYYGPKVPDQAPLVNPSAGTQGPVEQGMNDVNPPGPGPRAGGPAGYDQAPQNSSKGNPSY